MHTPERRIISKYLISEFVKKCILKTVLRSMRFKEIHPIIKIKNEIKMTIIYDEIITLLELELSAWDRNLVKKFRRPFPKPKSKIKNQEITEDIVIQKP